MQKIIFKRKKFKNLTTLAYFFAQKLFFEHNNW